MPLHTLADLRLSTLERCTGGHTYESLALVATLPADRYTPRLYIYSEGDSMSLRKAVELEDKIAASGIKPDGELKVSL